jgi:hypothetical protein
MTKSAQDFARDMTAIVDASAHALTTVNRVLELQQQHILALATAGGVLAPPPAATADHARHVEVVASRAGATASAAPASTADADSHAAMSPEDLLALAQKTAQALIDHSPAVAISSLYQAASHAVGIAVMNTATAQQQLSIIAQAVVTQGAANQLSRQRATPPPREKGAAEPTPAALRGQAPGALAR